MYKWITEHSNIKGFYPIPGQINLDAFIFLKILHEHELLSRNLKGDYDEPIAHTWYEANKMCNDRGRNLPSFVSYQDVEKLKKFLKKVSWSALVTHIFIGIHKKVIMIIILSTTTNKPAFYPHSLNTHPVYTVQLNPHSLKKHPLKLHSLNQIKRYLPNAHPLNRRFSKLTKFSVNCHLANDWTYFVEHKL